MVQVFRNDGTQASLSAALRLEGLAAPFVVEGPVNTAVFEVYSQPSLAPALRLGDIVLMDNLSRHKADAVRQLIQARGASVLFLPPYSPDLSPIDKAFSMLKQFLRRAKALTFDALLEASAPALQPISPIHAIAYFWPCGFLNID